MTNPTLDANTKSDLNAMLTTPLSAAELKKIKKDQLLILVGNDALERAGAARVKPAKPAKTKPTLSDELALRPVKRAPKKPEPKKPAAPREKAAAKAKGSAPRKPRTLAPHVYCQPAAKPEGVTALVEGSKKHLLAKTLLKGATIEQLMKATSWNRSTVQSSFGYDMKNSGFGVERRADQKYYLLMNKKLKRLPIKAADKTRAASVVDACS